MPILNDGTPVAAASVTVMTISYAQLSEEVGEYLGIGRSSFSDTEETRVNSIIRSGLRQVYYPQHFKPGMTHQWSFMRPEAQIITTAAYSTGTVEISSGVVTLSGGTWPSWSAQGELNINSQVYTVNVRDSDTQITLDDLSATAAAGTTHSLNRPSYDLPEGFDGSFDGNLHYKTGDNTLWPSVKITSPAIVRGKKQTYNGSDRPIVASVQPKSFVAATGQRWEITFYPSPSASWTFYGRYKISAKYPLGGVAMAEVFLESCLAVAEKRFVEDSKIHREEFTRLLAQAISHDADAFSADFLGYNSDNSDSRGLNDNTRYVGNAIHSYEGVVYRD